MSSKLVSAAVCCCYSLLLLSAASAVATPPVADAIAVAARVLKQLTVSDQQLILLKLCMSGCARVFGYGSES
jgi:hypothetical protein